MLNDKSSTKFYFYDGQYMYRHVYWSNYHPIQHKVSLISKPNISKYLLISSKKVTSELSKKTKRFCSCSWTLISILFNFGYNYVETKSTYHIETSKGWSWPTFCSIARQPRGTTQTIASLRASESHHPHLWKYQLLSWDLKKSRGIQVQESEGNQTYHQECVGSV